MTNQPQPNGDPSEESDKQYLIATLKETRSTIASLKSERDALAKEVAEKDKIYRMMDEHAMIMQKDLDSARAEVRAQKQVIEAAEKEHTRQMQVMNALLDIVKMLHEECYLHNEGYHHSDLADKTRKAIDFYYNTQSPPNPVEPV